jgi:hypothetical protein
LAALVAMTTARAANDLSAFVGRWTIDLQRTRMERFGPGGQNMVRPPTYTFIFAADGPNLKQSIYGQYPKSKPDRVLAVITDDKPHLCDDPVSCLSTGSSREQSFIYQQIDSHLLVRIFSVKGQIDEYSTYAVSSDGQTFTLVTWSPATPFWQNVQVFDKQH